MKEIFIESSLILLVDDDFKNLQLLGKVLKNKGYKTEFATSGNAAIDWLNKKKFSLILLDVTMPEMDGFEVCELIRNGTVNNEVPIIFLSGKTEKADILHGFKIGAQDYITKPFDEEILLARVRTHLLLYYMQKDMEQLVSKRTQELEISQLELKKSVLELEILKDRLIDENQYMQEEIKLNHNFEEIIGESKSLKKTLLSVQQVAKTNSTVLIKGETGTGKELIARSINNLSDRSKQPLIKLNCAALPENLIESELFGHEKGAFTSAINSRKGKFEIANNGTLFLDEIGELPFSLQPKLLRVLQEGEFERIGGNKTIKVDVRLISATNRDLEKMIEEKKFRSDLYYRLNIFPVEIEPLRKRVSDIPLLVNYFVDKHAKKLNKGNLRIQKDQLVVLEKYSWPGNVRELENVIERVIISATGKNLNFDRSFFSKKPQDIALQPLHEMEKMYILKVLKSVNWSISGENGAASILKLHPNTLRSKMEKLGIKKNISFN